MAEQAQLAKVQREAQHRPTGYEEKQEKTMEDIELDFKAFFVEDTLPRVMRYFLDTVEIRIDSRGIWISNDYATDDQFGKSRTVSAMVREFINDDVGADDLRSLIEDLELALNIARSKAAS